MATLTAGSDNAIRMDQLDANDLNDGDVTVQTSTRESIDTGDGYLDTFLGSGFTYQSGVPTGGTVSEYDLTLNGTVLFKVTGASVSATDLYHAISNDDTGAALDLLFRGDDAFTGSIQNDYLDARGGNNAINGAAGSDTILAGSGNNHIYGNAFGSVQGASDGGDTITAGNGSNYINGNAGNDVIAVGDGANRVFGGSGDDPIQLGNGNNTVNGNIGNDTIVAGGGNNVLHGGQGDDQFFTNQSSTVDANIEIGDLGNDQFHTGVGYDLMTGGAGADVFWLGGQLKGSAAAVIAGTTYYDEVTDFSSSEDHFVIRSFVPDQVLSSANSYTSESAAEAAAQSQLSAANDAHAVVVSSVGQDTYLFFDSTGSSTAIDSYLKLDGVQPAAVAISSFLDGSTF